MRKLLALGAFSAFLVAHAAPPDVPALPDGGSLVTSAGAAPGDGGGPWVTVDTAQVDDWVATIRCSSRSGSPNVHYRFTADAGTATTSDNVLTANVIYDVPVAQGYGSKFRYVSFLGEDGGAPACSIFHNKM